MWLKEHLEQSLLGVILVTSILLLCMVWFTDYGLCQIIAKKPNPINNELYLLSSIAQGLSAVLALLVTLSLIATQLAAGAYTLSIIKQRLTDYWLWFAVTLYLIPIVYSLLVLGNSGGWLESNKRDIIDTSLILAITALVYIVPFIIAMLKALQPHNIANWFVSKDDFNSLEELMGRAVDERRNSLNDALNLYKDRARYHLNHVDNQTQMAEDLVQLLLSIGKHSIQRRNYDALKEVLECLSGLVRYCNAFPRMWRQAADIFNEALIELYADCREWKPI